jgi:hypothetical protein
MKTIAYQLSKAVLTIVIYLLSTHFSVAQFLPGFFNYQTIVRDASGAPITNQSVSFRITILNSFSGQTDYQETHDNVTTNEFGLVTLQVGRGSNQVGSLANMGNPALSAYERFITIEIDIAGGTNYVGIGGLTRLASVPYAFYAGSASALKGNYIADNPTNGQVLRYNAVQQSWVPEDEYWFPITDGVEHRGVAVTENKITFDNGPNIQGYDYGTGADLLLGFGNLNAVGVYRYGSNQLSLEPYSHNAINLGANAWRWKEIWSVNALNTSSDARLKKEVTPISNGLSKVLHMKPVAYKWIEEDGHTHLGFLAQDLEMVLPEVVRAPQKINEAELKGRTAPEGNESHYAVSYSEIIPVLVKAIQEQQAMIESLKNEIQLLKK